MIRLKGHEINCNDEKVARVIVNLIEKAGYHSTREARSKLELLANEIDYLNKKIERMENEISKK